MMNELKALILISGDNFICNLHYAFQDERCIYLVLDLCKGGDLRYNLRNSPSNRFSEERARFYFCQILLALDKCHKHKILHRDVKPENVLMTDSGYVKLSDFGVAKILNNLNECYSTSGTHGYMSPEVYEENHRHGPPADFFSLGITLHEMVCGRRPFESNRLQAFRFGNDDPLRPVFVEKMNHVSESCKDFIVALLNPKEHRRLGTTRGFDEIIRHKWLGSVDLELLQWGVLSPPFVPDIGQNDFKADKGGMEIFKKEFIRMQSSQIPAASEHHRFSEYCFSKLQNTALYNNRTDKINTFITPNVTSSIGNLSVYIKTNSHRVSAVNDNNTEGKMDEGSSDSEIPRDMQVKDMKYHQLSSASLVLSSSEMDDDSGDIHRRVFL